MEPSVFSHDLNQFDILCFSDTQYTHKTGIFPCSWRVLATHSHTNAVGKYGCGIPFAYLEGSRSEMFLNS